MFLKKSMIIDAMIALKRKGSGVGTLPRKERKI
jgi:hypothetical protein